MAQSESNGHNANPCKFVRKCPMYPQFKNEFGLRMFKLTYCESTNYPQCARYKLASKGTMPPGDLLPNGRTLARGTQ